MYTSGSTGTPKAVMVPRAAVVGLVKGADYLQPGPADVIGQLSNVAFDAATFEIWGALLNGARLVMLDKDTALSPERLAAAVEATGINVLFMTTALLNVLAGSAPALFGRLDHLLFGGEAVVPRRVAMILAASPPGRVLHVYGPTETTTFATWHPVEAVAADAATIPIGTPLANTRVYVLDADLQPCPAGVVGELYIAGAGLARGYRNRPGLTAERFVANPFAITPGERLYRTGDRAAWRTDGKLDFHGRTDFQLKLRGFRIEPGEIEAALTRAPAIAQAAVIARTDGAGDPRLVAYLVPRQPAPQQPDALDLQALRQHLATQLPDYMIPAAFVVLAALPLTPNGKLDRAALPAPEGSGLATDYVAPTTPEETLLCDLVADLLGLDRVGLADNFFHLGGHSLLATRLAARVRARLGRELPLHTVYQFPVLGELARQIGLVTDSRMAFDVLLPIRTQGTLPPLFCLHPGTGLCWPYTSLLRHTAAEQPIYGIQARGFAGARDLPGSLEEIAAEGLEKIRAVRARGPCRLLGWSFGGIIAHMIATRLQSEGETGGPVDHLILFDAYPPAPRADGQAPGIPGRDEIWREIARGTSLDIPPEVNNRALNAETIVSLARGQSHILGTFPLQQLEQLAAVMANNARLFPTARLDTFDGDITLFVARRQTPGLERMAISPDAWRPFCTGSIRTIGIDAEHHQMLSSAALGKTGDVLFSL